jgi:hypothetical protein
MRVGGQMHNLALAKKGQGFKPLSASIKNNNIR